MEWIHVFVGIGFIGIGFLVKAFPNLISGINTMSQEERDKIDLKGLSTALRNLFIVWGVIFAVGWNFLIWIGWGYIAGYIPIVSGVTFIICIFIFQVIYTIKKKKD